MKGLSNLAAFVIVAAVSVFFSVGLALIPLGLLIGYMFVGAEVRAEKALSRVGNTLMDGETLIADALQKRVFALVSRRVVLAITSSRFITIKRGLLGGFTMQDVQWKDLRDVFMEENVLPSLCGSNIAFRHSSRNVGAVVVNGLDSDVTSTIYTKAQFEEQAWEEKRRVRDMEEVRAAGGGVTVNTGHAGPSEPAKRRAGNPVLDEIIKAKELLDMGAISDAEFQEMKSKVLAS